MFGLLSLVTPLPLSIAFISVPVPDGKWDVLRERQLVQRSVTAYRIRSGDHRSIGSASLKDSSAPTTGVPQSRNKTIGC
jgi:hypothetical protein